MVDTSEDPLDWFVVVDDTLDPEGPMPEGDPEMPEGPTTLVRRLRELVPTWRSLGIVDEDTVAAYGNGRLQVNIELEDRASELSIGCLRVDLTDAGWVAGWVAPELATAESFEEANPVEQTNGAATDIDGAADWLRTQLERPIVRYRWHTADGATDAELWRLEDTCRSLVIAGPTEARQDPSTADSATRVR